MDISGVGFNEFSQITDTKRRQAELEGFQSLLNKAAGSAGTQDEKADRELREACESFESYFIQTMFREMRKTSFDENGFIAKSQAEKMFTDMMDEETAKTAAKTGGIGLADMMYKQMTQFKTEEA